MAHFHPSSGRCEGIQRRERGRNSTPAVLSQQPSSYKAFTVNVYLSQLYPNLPLERLTVADLRRVGSTQVMKVFSLSCFWFLPLRRYFSPPLIERYKVLRSHADNKVIL